MCVCEELFSKEKERKKEKKGFKCQSQVCKLCFGKELSIYVYIRVYFHIYAELFPKTQSLNLALHLKPILFLEWPLTHFGEERKSSSYVQDVPQKCTHSLNGHY